MPKAATETKTKSATKTANTKTKVDKPAKDDKAKRPPSAYNQFMKDHLSDYKEKHPDLNHKEAFAAVASMWKDAPENPNKNKPAPKKTSEKENDSSKSKSKLRSKKTKTTSEPEEEDAPQSDEE